MDLLPQFDKNEEMVKDRITTESLNERSGLTSESSVLVGTTLLDGQASPTTTAALVISSFQFLLIQLLSGGLIQLSNT